MCLARSLVKLPVSSDHFIWYLVTRTVGYVKNHGQELIESFWLSFIVSLLTPEGRKAA